MLKAFFVIALLLVASDAGSQSRQLFVVGEWAGDCAADFRIGYRLNPSGKLIAYTVNKGVEADFGSPTVTEESAEFFTLDFNDGGGPTFRKIAGTTIRPWRQGPDGSVIKDGMRDGTPTPIFKRCR